MYKKTFSYNNLALSMSSSGFHPNVKYYLEVVYDIDKKETIRTYRHVIPEITDHLSEIIGINHRFLRRPSILIKCHDLSPGGTNVIREYTISRDGSKLKQINQFMEALKKNYEKNL